ncbi:CYTH domain-containing protein [Ruthenibacterium sp. CLA-JM-H11]|uniref:CYTH domain-containing protein n=1 Tax=Ruthenibacterium intestinale TaxID=3133163 RepID=A0ABV1GIR1_9FIRM
MEIERRWKIAGFPENLPLLRQAHMRQGYIATAPVVRIRTDGARCVLCFKGKGTLAREEIETDIDAETFRRLEAFIGKPLVSKDYRVYALPDGRRLEVSLVDEDLPTRFFYAEVEFDTVEQAQAYVPPADIGLQEEMTEDRGFSMSAYWKRTRLGD